jgi:hypothetical protein|tara:strand:- start:438 stop:998 length:561 start_codon:yes stop_codon:yes gene_type:complete
MAFNITEFQGQLTGGGARPNLFQVTIDNPVDRGAFIKTSFMVQAAQIPEATLGQATVNYFGRQVKLAGNRTFPDWTVTIMNDEDFLVRDGMERWSNAINGLESNLRSAALATTAQYKTNATVTQFGKQGNPIRTYNFVGIFPITVGSIALDWGTNDAVETFDVTFAYDYWQAGEGVIGQVTNALFG